MTFLKNTSFVGVNLINVEPDSLIRTADIATAQGDIAGVKAHLFDNTEAGHIDHSGPGRGALLGYPLVNQVTPWSLLVDTGTAKNGGIVTGDRYWFMWIVPPHNEDSLDVEIQVSGSLFQGPFLSPQVYLTDPVNIDTSRMADARVPLVASGNQRNGVLRCTLRGVTKGLPALLIVDIPMLGEGGQRATSFEAIGSVIVRPSRAGVPASDIARDGTNPVPVEVPLSSEHLRFQDMSADAFNVALPLHGWSTAWLDRNINGVMESMTGAPAGTNQSYTHTESALANPTRDRFRAFTRKTFADEPIPLIPLLSHCTGGIKNTGGYLVAPRATAGASATTSENNRRAFAHYFNVTTKTDYIHPCVMPDIPSGAGVVRWAALLASSNITAFANARMSAGWIGFTESAQVTPTVVAGTVTANSFGYAQGTLPDHGRDSIATINFLFEQVSGTYAPPNFALVAVALWVEP